MLLLKSPRSLELSWACFFLPCSPADSDLFLTVARITLYPWGSLLVQKFTADVVISTCRGFGFPPWTHLSRHQLKLWLIMCTEKLCYIKFKTAFALCQKPAHSVSLAVTVGVCLGRLCFHTSKNVNWHDSVKASVGTKLNAGIIIIFFCWGIYMTP